jgi:hypothetical protein
LAIAEAVCSKNAKVPRSISILRKADIEWHCIVLEPGNPLAGTGPAMMKIMLGFLHCCWGPAYTSLSAFDRFRVMLTAEAPVTDSVSLSENDSRTAPVPLVPGTHLVWGMCEDGQRFSGGVSLYGKWTYEFSLKDFGLLLEGRVCGIPVYAR